MADRPIAPSRAPPVRCRPPCPRGRGSWAVAGWLCEKGTWLTQEALTGITSWSIFSFSFNACFATVSVKPPFQLRPHRPAAQPRPPRRSLSMRRTFPGKSPRRLRTWGPRKIERRMRTRRWTRRGARCWTRRTCTATGWTGCTRSRAPPSCSASSTSTRPSVASSWWWEPCCWSTCEWRPRASGACFQWLQPLGTESGMWSVADGRLGAGTGAGQVMLSESVYQNCLETDFSFAVIYKNC